MVTSRLDWTETKRVEAISFGADLLLKRMASAPSEATVWCLREVVWPGLARDAITDAWIKAVDLALVPLSRIGQMEGKSGSLVLVGRFWSRSQSRPSNALIVKTRRKTGATNALDQEWRAALAAKPHTYDRKDSFAIPVHFDTADPEYELLWSLCLPTVRESEADAIDYGSFPKVDDLRTLLGSAPRRVLPESPDGDAQAKTVLERTYGLLRNLHRSSAITGSSALPREDRAIREEYDWYLRRYGTEPGDLWGAEWATVWGSPTQRGGGDFVNPLWMVAELKELRFSMQLGLVHGDLHPGNIIVRDDDPPAIIDFGWSNERAHVAKDFALMECNLRFLTLRAQIAEADLETFTHALPWGAEAAFHPDSYLARRWKLVQVVRQAAQRLFAADTDWDREYLVPLFLVAFGLLRFAPQLGNQRAATLLVERLARHLARALALGRAVA
jgi:hypothetical protein